VAQSVALVVGGAGVVGAAVARRLASGGCRVVLHYDRAVSAAEQIVADIRAAGGEAVPAQADLRDEQEVKRVLETGELFFGPVDALVACACPDRAGAADDAACRKLLLEQFQEQVRGVVNTVRAVARGMAVRRCGRIVCVTSDPASRRPPPESLEHAGSSVHADQLAVQLGPYALAGYGFGARSAPDARPRGAPSWPGEARLPTPEEVARIVTWFVEQGTPPRRRPTRADSPLR